MAVQSSYTDGHGDIVLFAVDLAPDPEGTGPYAVTVYFGSESKFLQCQMYGPDSSHPADPVGQQRFIEQLGRAIAQDAQTNPNAPMAAQFAFSMDPARAEEFARKMVTGDGPIQRNCLWSENSDPNTDLTIKVAVNGDNMNARAELVDGNGKLAGERDSFADGSANAEEFDTQDTHPYSKLGFSTDASNKVTAAQVTLDPNVLAAGMSVGQIFGSALGGALGGNSLVGNLAASTIGGLIGQKFVQVLATAMTADLSTISLSDVFAGQGISVANAGLGAISSFLTAELGHELGLTGFGAELFNGAVGGVTGSVLTQVATKVAAGYSFDAAIGFINWGTAATQAGYNVSAAVGSFLAHAFVPAESQEGAVGGQLLGAVGSALGLSAVINASLTGILGFLIPGLGSFFGTIVGTILGDVIAGDPANPKATHDVEILGSDTHFQNRLVGTDDHGNAAVSKEMGDQVTTIANSYLDAVHGAGIAYSGKVMIGYNSGAAPYQYITGWFPNGTEVTPHFANATDAIQEGVRELLVNTEVIGGDLLVKRAHQAFMNGPHPVPTEVSPDFSDLIGLSGDLSVAQDYENYLNNREAINALMAANPDTAFGFRRRQARTVQMSDGYQRAA